MIVLCCHILTKLWKMLNQGFKLLDMKRHKLITLDNYFFGIGKDRSMDSLDGKDIFIEEFSMLSNRWMIYKAFAKFNNKVYSFSDCSQCEPLEAGSQMHYNYQLSALSIKCVAKQRQ